MKQAKTPTKLVKLVRRNRKKVRRYLKVLSKKRTRMTTKLVKLIRKNNRKVRKYFKTLSKKRAKTTLKLVKQVRKNATKIRRYFKVLSAKRILIASSLIILSVIVGASVGLVYAAQISKTKPDAQITEKVLKPGSEAPNPTTSAGPAQSNSLFSVYPSWAQDFSSDTSGKLNRNYWEVAQGPAQNSNNEAEYYTDNSANLRIQNGALTLEATQQPEPQNYKYASARLDTDSRVSFLYGRIDITAKLPDGVGTWPAAWLLPANNKYEDLSPASDSTRYLNGGEIDLIEEVGFQPNLEYGIVHTLSDLGNPNGVGSYNTVTVPNNDTTYNKYSLLWTPTSITFEVNDIPFYTYDRQTGADYTTWPFDQPFYLILNLAIGGTWGGEDTAQFPNGIDNSILPATMSIRSIYYYPYMGNPTS